jgi:hypothetical protein
LIGHHIAQQVIYLSNNICHWGHGTLYIFLIWLLRLYWCSSSPCVSYVASFPGLSICDCPSLFFNVYLGKCKYDHDTWLISFYLVETKVCNVLILCYYSYLIDLSIFILVYQATLVTNSDYVVFSTTRFLGNDNDAFKMLCFKGIYLVYSLF